MALNITPVTNHREREKGCIIYPVYSRRSAGLSIGINLYPDKKYCLFNCPYCEVFPFNSNAIFDIQQMEEDLKVTVLSAQKQKIPIKDICFSGNGEPTLSPAFADSLKLAEEIRAEMCPTANLVVISNGTGLLQPEIFSLLKEFAARETSLQVANPQSSLNIWLKLDAGTPDWYQKMNRSAIPHEKLSEKIKEFVLSAPVTLQTMLCAIDGEPPPEKEKQEWEKLVNELAKNNIRKIQLYGKARSAPKDPLASELPAEYLEMRAASLRNLFAENGVKVPVDVYL